VIIYKRSMKFLIILASMALMASAKPQHVPKFGLANGRIIGGHEAEPHAYPWQISLTYSGGSHICGGSIINEKQVICAAHCVEGMENLAIVAGAHKRNFEFGHQNRIIESMEFNSNFSSEDFEDDISIITVTEAFDFSDPHVQPIDMFKTDDAEIPDGTTCVSTGWGLTTGGGIFAPNKLQVVEIDILNQEECNVIFQGYIKPGMICAGEAGAAPCNGDSGGPLVCPDGNGNNKLAGIVSFGENGCTTTGVYTRVSHYEEWISERIVA